MPRSDRTTLVRQFKKKLKEFEDAAIEFAALGAQRPEEWDGIELRLQVARLDLMVFVQAALLKKDA